MAKYMSPHLRLHGNPGMKHENKEGGGGVKSKLGAQHEDEGELHRAAGAEPEHVTKTHPGETHPHPATGVHAVHVHHVGGHHEAEAHGSGSHGHQFMTHTHHQDGSVETQGHDDLQSVHNTIKASFPTSEGDDQQHDQNADNDSYAGGGSIANMSSLGGR